MIADWRARWKQEDFPFVWVQLPNYREAPSAPCPADDIWPVIRESMSRALQTPRTGMTVNLDIGMAKNIHPVNKQEIGKRLSLWARANVYDEKIPWSGPVFDAVAFAGTQATVTFRHADNLRTTDGTPPKAFVVAGDDKMWTLADAKIQDGKVVVSHPGGMPVKSVRYAWANNPSVNLTNDSGLPAAPFRTDDWPVGN
jgi:sialate O-acetylesterase